MYSLVNVDDREVKEAKRVNKSVVGGKRRKECLAYCRMFSIVIKGTRTKFFFSGCVLGNGKNKRKEVKRNKKGGNKKSEKNMCVLTLY